MEKPEQIPTTNKRLKTSTKLFLLEVICFFAAILLWHITCVYYDGEDILYDTIYMSLLIACFFIGAAMIVAVLGERKQLRALGIPRLASFLAIVLLLWNIHAKQINTWRYAIWELDYREYTIENLGETLIEYSKAHGGNLPSSTNWCDELNSFGSDLTSTLFDYKRRMEPHCTVAFNKNISGANLQSLSSNTILLFESDGPWNLSGGPELFHSQSKDKEFAFVILADGKTYKYFFSRGKAKEISSESYVSIQWNP